MLKAPHPLPPGVEPWTFFRARGAIYGTRDAGREWWLYFSGRLVAHGWVASRYKQGLFQLWDGDALVGILVCQGDQRVQT